MKEKKTLAKYAKLFAFDNAFRVLPIKTIKRR